jgi:hypothetical protein
VPNRPPKKWWDYTYHKVRQTHGEAATRKIVGNIWHHQLTPEKRKEILAENEHRKNPTAGSFFTFNKETNMKRRHHKIRIIKLRHNATKWHRPRVSVSHGHFRHAPKSRFFGVGPVKVNRHRRHHSYRMNPLNVKGVIRQITNKRWLISTAMIGGGIAAGMATKSVSEMLLKQLKLDRYDKYSGALSIVIGALLIGMMKKRQVKEIGAIIAGAGLYDLVAQNVKALKLTPLPTISLPKLPGMAPAAVSASYATAVRPVSPVARVGLQSSYGVVAPAGYGSSYQANVPTQGFSGMDNPYADIEGFGD